MSAGEGPFTRTREPAGAAMEELARQRYQQKGRQFLLRPRVNGGDQCGAPGPRAEKDPHKGCGKQLSRHTGDPDSKPDDDRIHESPPPRSETTMLRTMRPETRKPYRGKLFLSMRGTFPRIK